MLEKTIKFGMPITVDGKVVEQVTMRRPKVKDQKLAQTVATTRIDIETTMLSYLTGLPVAAFDDMDLADYQQLQEAFADFLSPLGPKPLVA